MRNVKGGRDGAGAAIISAVTYEKLSGQKKLVVINSAC